MTATAAAEIIAGHVRSIARERDVPITQALVDEVVSAMRSDSTRLWLWRVARRAHPKTVYRLALRERRA
jgi:hypothetical protein